MESGRGRLGGLIELPAPLFAAIGLPRCAIRTTRTTNSWSSWLAAGEVEDAFGDDVALDLRGTG